MESTKGRWLVIRKKFSIEQPGGEAPTSDNPATIKYSLVPTDRQTWVLLTGWVGPTCCAHPGTGYGDTRSHQQDPPDHPVEASDEIPARRGTGADAFLSRHTADHSGELVAALTRLTPRSRARSRGEGWHWDPWAAAGEGCAPAPHLPSPPPGFRVKSKERKTFSECHTGNLAGPEDTSRMPASPELPDLCAAPSHADQPRNLRCERSYKKEQKARCITRARFTRKHGAWWQCTNVTARLGTREGAPLRRSAETSLYILCLFRQENGVKNTFKNFLKDFPGGPVAKTPRFHCRGRGFDPGSGK